MHCEKSSYRIVLEQKILRKNSFFQIVFFFIIVIGLSQTFSETQFQFKNLVLKAEKISQDSQNKKIQLKGNVKIFYKDIKFLAEDAIIDLKKKTIEIKKKAKFSSKDLSAEAEKLFYNYEKHTGIFHKAVIKSGKTTFEGEIITQESLKKYIIKNGFYTSCSNCPPLWSFSSSEIHAVLGEYAYIKHPKLKIFKMPLLYSPVFIIPLKTKRQSGLLPPSLYINELGTLALSQSYFWALSRSNDLTLTGSYYYSRGFKWITDYRYILNEDSKGQLKAGTINDSNFNDRKGEQRRWFVQYQHYQKLGRQTIQRAQFSWIGDIQYPQEFPRDIPSVGEPALENRISFTKNSNTHHFHLEADYYLNLLKNDVPFKNDDAVHRLPAISYSLIEIPLLDSPLKFDFNALYTNFFRHGLNFDDVEESSVIEQKQTACKALDTKEKIETCLSQIRYIKTDPDGIFDPERDILRTGQRLEFQPTFSLPLQVKKLINITPSFSYKGSYYVFPDLNNNKKSTFRQFIETSIRWETQAQAVFKKTTKRYQHKFKQIFEYSHIPWTSHNNHIFFGNFTDKPYRLSQEILTEDDFYSENHIGEGKVQFDYNDRLFRKKIISYTLINEIREKYKNQYKKLMAVSLSQYYDFNQKTIGKLTPWSPFLGKIQWNDNFFTSYFLFKYYTSLERLSFYTRLEFIFSYYLSMGVSYDKGFSVDSEGEVIKTSFNEDWSLDFSFKNSFLKFKGKINYSTLSKIIKSWEYSTSLLLPGECWHINFGQIRPINSEPIFQLNFLFRFNE